MTISFSCECGKKYQVADENGGKKSRCKTCGAVIVIPEAPSETPLELTAIDEVPAEEKPTAQQKEKPATPEERMDEELKETFGKASSAAKKGAGRAWDGLKTAGEMAKTGKKLAALNLELNRICRELGSAAFEQEMLNPKTMDDGGQSLFRVEGTRKRMEEVKGFIEAADRRYTSASGAKEKALAAKDIAAAKAARKKAELDLDKAHQNLGEYVLRFCMEPEGKAEALQRALEIEDEIKETKQDISDLGGVLYKNKLGAAAVVLIAIILIYIVLKVVF
ncbi:MAG: hypothetical protein JXR97_04895 [Planctomycetes bacterium]|nr:hypothetical protein [Planctomycetota bacterium]